MERAQKASHWETNLPNCLQIAHGPQIGPKIAPLPEALLNYKIGIPGLGTHIFAKCRHKTFFTNICKCVHALQKKTSRNVFKWGPYFVKLGSRSHSDGPNQGFVLQQSSGSMMWPIHDFGFLLAQFSSEMLMLIVPNKVGPEPAFRWDPKRFVLAKRGPQPAVRYIKIHIVWELLT